MVVGTEHEAGADYGVGEAGLPQVLFHQGLGAEVGEFGAPMGVQDTQVDEPLDAGLFGGVYEELGVPDCVGEFQGSLGEAGPVGVVEGVATLEPLREPGGVVEIVWVGFHGVEVDLGLGVVLGFRRFRPGYGLDPLAVQEEHPGDVAAGVAESAGDHVQVVRVQAVRAGPVLRGFGIGEVGSLPMGSLPMGA